MYTFGPIASATYEQNQLIPNTRLEDALDRFSENLSELKMIVSLITGLGHNLLETPNEPDKKEQEINNLPMGKIEVLDKLNKDFFILNQECNRQIQKLKSLI